MLDRPDAYSLVIRRRLQVPVASSARFEGYTTSKVRYLPHEGKSGSRDVPIVTSLVGLLLSLISQYEYAPGMLKKLGAIVGFALVLTSMTVTESQAVTKAGGSCSKAGVVSKANGKKYTCVLSGKKLIWNKGNVVTQVIPLSTPSPTPTPAASSKPKLGSFSLPISSGSQFQIGKLTYSIYQVKFDVNAAVCAGNGFNGGCTYDSNFNSIVDPQAANTWVGVAISVSNQSNEILSPADFNKSFYLVLPNGQLLQSSDFVSGYRPLLSDVQIIPGGSGSGDVLFAVPKTTTSLKTLLVLRDTTQFFSPQDYYFEIHW